MARPVDPHRRAHTLGRAADYVLENGLEELSLRPLAAALGTSTRMLLYDFESKEQLVDAVLAEIRRRLAERLAEGGPTTLGEIWDWVSAEERAPFMRVFFETHVRALSDPEAHRPMIDDWLRFLESRWQPESLDPATATLFVAVVRGLLLDRLTAPDPERVDAAMRRFSELVSGS
jgi:AcrR family transcriptional regulator